MPGVDGHSMTNIEGGGSDVAENSTIEKNNNTQPQPADTAGTDGGATDPEVGADGGEDEGTLPGEGEGTASELDENGNPIEGDVVNGESEPAPGALTPEQISEMVAKGIQDAMEKNKPAPSPELTDEQWTAKEQEVGVDRKAIQFFTGQAMKVYNAIQEAMDARFAKFEKAEALQSLSRTKGFEDAGRFQKGVDEFLSKYQPKYHSNIELLKMGVIYARGLARSGDVRRANVNSERNKRVAGVARPASPGSASGARKPNIQGRPLNPSQKEVASKFGMTEQEYRNLQNTRGKPIAV